jgi:ribosome-binding protein aMBF1 (putative translation factor)
MNSLLEKERIVSKLQEVLRFQNNDEKLDFEAEMIHLEVMNHIRLLMEKQGMNKKMLAEKLQTSKGYVSQLFSGDKIINLKLLAKLQHIFNIQFTITPQEMTGYSTDIPLVGVRKVYQFSQWKESHHSKSRRSKQEGEYFFYNNPPSKQKVA